MSVLGELADKLVPAFDIIVNDVGEKTNNVKNIVRKIMSDLSDAKTPDEAERKLAANTAALKALRDHKYIDIRKIDPRSKPPSLTNGFRVLLHPTKLDAPDHIYNPEGLYVKQYSINDPDQVRSAMGLWNIRGQPKTVVEYDNGEQKILLNKVNPENAPNHGMRYGYDVMYYRPSAPTHFIDDNVLFASPQQKEQFVQSILAGNDIHQSYNTIFSEQIPKAREYAAQQRNMGVFSQQEAARIKRIEKIFDKVHKGKLTPQEWELAQPDVMDTINKAIQLNTQGKLTPEMQAYYLETVSKLPLTGEEKQHIIEQLRPRTAQERQEVAETMEQANKYGWKRILGVGGIGLGAIGGLYWLNNQSNNQPIKTINNTPQTQLTQHPQAQLNQQPQTQLSQQPQNTPRESGSMPGLPSLQQLLANSYNDPLGERNEQTLEDIINHTPPNAPLRYYAAVNNLRQQQQQIAKQIQPIAEKLKKTELAFSQLPPEIQQKITPEIQQMRGIMQNGQQKIQALNQQIQQLQEQAPKPPPGYQLTLKQLLSLGAGLLTVGLLTRNNAFAFSGALQGFANAWMTGNVERMQANQQRYAYELNAWRTNIEALNKEITDVMNNTKMSLGEKVDEINATLRKYGIVKSAEVSDINSLSKQYDTMVNWVNKFLYQANALKMAQQKMIEEAQIRSQLEAQRLEGEAQLARLRGQITRENDKYKASLGINTMPMMVMPPPAGQQ